MTAPKKPSTQKNTANQKAYTYHIVPKNSGLGEDHSVHEMSPSWVLTFVRWEYRDLFRTQVSEPFQVSKPLVVENDCIAVSTVNDKGSPTPSCNITLKETDVNYETEIAPGDFVFINMLDWEAQSRRVADNARKLQPINGEKDGFKGIYKVQSVRKTVSVQPNTGVKTVIFRIDGWAFTEFNNVLYFNPNLVPQQDIQNVGLFLSDIIQKWASLTTMQGEPYLQYILTALIDNFIGVSQVAKTLNSSSQNLIANPNTYFRMPSLVGSLLGITKSNLPNATDYISVVAARDIYNYIFGIQQYGSNPNQGLNYGMNPSNIQSQQYNSFYYTSIECPGNSILKPDMWNQVKLWNVMQQYTNAPLNELFVTFRIGFNNRVMPTVIFRQIPFTSEDFTTQEMGVLDSTSSTIPVTKFLSLPRWKIHPAYVFSYDLGRDEAARFNWVQYYAQSTFDDNGIANSGETASHNYVYDSNDISRSGLRPYNVQNNFADLPDVEIKESPAWARILGDALIGGHLRMNGTLNCIGIPEPIAVGDNVEFDGVVYHIEQVLHSCSINTVNGIKSFRTTLKLSHGVSVYSNSYGTRYAEMTDGNAYYDRTDDYKNEKILPGVSESQDTVYRPINLDHPEFDKNETNRSFPQPSTTKNVPNKGK